MRIAFSNEVWTALDGHFDTWAERAAFLFCQRPEGMDGPQWAVRDRWLLDDEADYDDRGEEHLSLSDDIRPRVIRHAHAHNLAVIEAHSHYWTGETRFSPYDLRNLHDFAAHMLWRLPARPYTALVLGKDSFDALSWTPPGAVSTPEITVGGLAHAPTGLSLAHYHRMHAAEQDQHQEVATDEQ